MTLEEARKVLGLDPEADPAEQLEQFNEARERIAEMVRDAPNETIALRYQDGLLDFDKALAAVREEIERRRNEKVAGLVALVPSSVSGQHVVNKRSDFLKEGDPEAESASTPARKASEPESDPASEGSGKPRKFEKIIGVREPAKAAAVPVEESIEAEDFGEDFGEDSGEPAGARWRFVVYAVIFLLIGGIGGGWIYTSMEAEKRRRNQERVVFLEGLGARLVESRRWAEAEEAYREIEERNPGSKVAHRGHRSIEYGMEQEQKQFVGYWSGEALAAYEAGRIEDAAVAAKKVLAKYPDEKGTADLLVRIEAARVTKMRQQWRERIEAAVGIRDWKESDEALAGLAAALPEDPLIRELAALISAEKEQQRKDHARASELADAARLRDKGVFDRQALEWMREAVALAPEDAAVKALYEKLASYSRTLRVPEDAANLASAIAQARDRDRIVLGEGEFAGGVLIDTAVQLEGAGEGKTVLLMNATKGPVLTFGPGSKGATVTGLTLRHKGFDAGTSRYPVALIRGTEVDFSDCVFLEGSGHGLAAVDGAHGMAHRCVFKTNGWDGAAASGAGSRLTIRDSEAIENFGHGYEIWDGATAVITGSKATRNSRNGVLVDSAGEGIEITGGTFAGNREYGIVLGAGASGKVVDNGAWGNILGGLLIRFAAISVVVEDNRIEKNSGPGLLLEQGLRPDLYSGNRSRSNRGRNVMTQVQFDETP